MKTFANWCRQWGVNIKGTRSNAILISRRFITEPPPLTLEGVKISWSSQAKYLGVIIDKRLPWRQHVEFITTKVKALIHTSNPLLFAKSTMSLRNKLHLMA
ncbi:hypothetical protein Zmor_011984 [Zophobas morio]|uniref:RNA-directed DNA polymerase from mobile element jockey n=1 Tax=Zophobas morio TaxID=2755281 RepID=A0AA38LYL8_9CUCU|nr:hypothetical protein Zmor_011984 [Zophobas morio]